MAYNRYSNPQSERRGRGNRRFGAVPHYTSRKNLTNEQSRIDRGNGRSNAAPHYTSHNNLTNEQSQTGSGHDNQSGATPQMNLNRLSNSLRQTQSNSQFNSSTYMAQSNLPNKRAQSSYLQGSTNPGAIPTYIAQNHFANGRGQARLVGNGQFSARPSVAQNQSSRSQFQAPSNIQLRGSSHRGQSYSRNNRYQARRESDVLPDMTNCDPRLDTFLSPKRVLDKIEAGAQGGGFGPRTQGLLLPDSGCPLVGRNPASAWPEMNNNSTSNRPGMDRNSGPIRLGMNTNDAITRPALGQEIGERTRQKYQGYQTFRGRPYQPQWRQNSKLPWETNSNLSLIVLPRCPEPHPPRWRWEDAATVPAPRVEEPVIPESKQDDEDSENDEEEGKIRRSATYAETSVLLNSISRSPLHPAYVPHCPHFLEGRCKAASKNNKLCRDKLHFKRIIHSGTEIKLGDCSFLDSCDLAGRCPYIHYQPLFPKAVRRRIQELVQKREKVISEGKEEIKEEKKKEGTGGILEDHVDPADANAKTGIQFPPSIHPPPQWIKCDITQFDFKAIGKFGVIMADPPWDIRMILPYGTVADQAIVNLPLGDLQDEGLFFLWCTARTIDAGHACLKAWGYEYCDEIAWVKVDHTNRLISVGRTGHWLNHTMEHCLVGIKGDPNWIMKGCDMDVIVAQPRATSHKPDEIYEVIGRLVGPNVKKLELFGRHHNIRKGWLTLGNQLPHTYLHDEALKDSFMKSLARTGQSFTYNPNWNPWSNGFDRYGYGNPKDWREERKTNVPRSRRRNYRGINHRPHSLRPGFRGGFQGIVRGKRNENSYNNRSPENYGQKIQQYNNWRRQDSQQNQRSSQKGNQQGSQQGNQQDKAEESTDIRDHTSYNYPPPPTDQCWGHPVGLMNLPADNDNSKYNESDNKSHKTRLDGEAYCERGEEVALTGGGLGWK